MVSGRSFEDFLEVAYSESGDVIGIKYGVSKYLQAGEQGRETLINDIRVADQYEYNFFEAIFLYIEIGALM